MSYGHQMTLWTHLWRLGSGSVENNAGSDLTFIMLWNFDKSEILHLITDTRGVIWVCKWFQHRPNLNILLMIQMQTPKYDQTSTYAVWKRFGLNEYKNAINWLKAYLICICRLMRLKLLHLNTPNPKN